MIDIYLFLNQYKINPIDTGIYSAVFPYSDSQYLYVSVEQDKIDYLAALFKLYSIPYKNNSTNFPKTYSIIVTKLNKINLDNQDLIKCFSYINKNCPHPNLMSNYFLKYFKLEDRPLHPSLNKFYIALKKSSFILSIYGSDLQIDLRLNQFLLYKNQVICIDPVIF